MSVSELFPIFAIVEGLIYKFLDEYLGDEVSISLTFWVGITPSERYSIYSKMKKTLIIYLDKDVNGYFEEHSSPTLCRLVSDFFSINDIISDYFILRWFFDKRNIKSQSDCSKFLSSFSPL